MTTTPVAYRKVLRGGLETFICTEAEPTVSRHTFPQEVVRRRGFRDFQSINLNVCEWINSLRDVSVSKGAEV